MTDSNSQPDTSRDESPGSLRLTLVVCAIIIVTAAAIYWLIVSTQPEAERTTETRTTPMLVQVTEAEKGDFRPHISALGRVQAAREVELSARVSGEIIRRSADFDPGGFFEKGAVMLEIDPADYRIALQQRRSARDQAEADLKLEMGRQKIAESDFSLLEELGNAPAEEDRGLVLRQPQLQAAKARLDSAQAALKQAELDLERTSIKAPFDLQVIERHAEVGSQVAPGDSLADVVGIETYWVNVTVPVSALKWIELGEQGKGSKVEVRHRAAWPAGQSRQGRVVRHIGSLNEHTRLARLLVAVDDPLARESSEDEQARLIIGSILQCTITGRIIPDVVRIERSLLRGNGSVWVMDEQDKLRIAKPEIVFQDADHAFITGGLQAGDRIVTTNLSSVTEGAPLRLRSEAP